MDDPAGIITGLVSGFFHSGIRADLPVMRYAECVLGINDPEGDFLLPGDANGVLDEGLARLLFAPPLSLELALEPYIPEDGLNPVAIGRVSDALLGQVGRTAVYFPGAGPVYVAVGPEIIGGFMRALGLDRPVRCCPPVPAWNPPARERYMRARVMMRHYPWVATPARERFFSGVMSSALVQEHVPAEDFAGCIALALRVFGETAVDADIYLSISARKEQACMLLERAKEFGRALRENSMEYLMAFRLHPPVVNPDEAMRDIRCADLLCMAVFGKPALAGRCGPVCSLEVDRNMSVEDIMRFLP